MIKSCLVCLVAQGLAEYGQVELFESVNLNLYLAFYKLYDKVLEKLQSFANSQCCEQFSGWVTLTTVTATKNLYCMYFELLLMTLAPIKSRKLYYTWPESTEP